MLLEKYSLHTERIALLVWKSDFGSQNSLPISKKKKYRKETIWKPNYGDIHWDMQHLM